MSHHQIPVRRSAPEPTLAMLVKRLSLHFQSLGISRESRQLRSEMKPGHPGLRRQSPPPVAGASNGAVISVDELERAGLADCIGAAVNSQLLVGALGLFLCRRAGDAELVGDGRETQLRR